MKPIVLSTVVSVAMLTELWGATPSYSRASVADARKSNTQGGVQLAGNTSSKYAQLFYPPLGNQRAIMVVGQGLATMPADIGEVKLNIQDTTPDTSSLLDTISPLNLTPIGLTKERLQPIVDALIGIGVPANAIEVKINNSKSSNSFPFPFPFPSSNSSPAQVVVNLEKPTRARVQQVVTVAENAAKKANKLAIKGVSVEYAVKECQLLETAAYTAAVNNAKNRAQAIASAMGVELEKVPSVAELGLLDLFIPLCISKKGISSSSVFDSFKSPSDPVGNAEVELRRDVFVTYPIKQ